MFPFATLPANLAAFCERLRRNYGFRVGPRELADAARALTIVPLASERVVRDSLRPILAHTHADVLAFDDAFGRFFHARLFDASDDPRQQDREHPRGTGSPGRNDDADTSAGRDSTAATAVERGHAIDVYDGTRERDESTAVRVRASRLEGEVASPVLHPPDGQWRSAARAFVDRQQAALSRRWRPSPRGQRFDLRRTLRSSLHTSGEPVVPRWRARERRRARFVILVDGSRSMGQQAVAALQVAAAIASATPHVEVFTFSTAVQRVTPEVRRVAAGGSLRLPPLQRAWGGGTSIGGSLHELLHRWGDRLLGRQCVVIIASDGLEAGDPSVLRDAMARLRRESASIVWLNPLIVTPGYEPSAQGMRVARPFLTAFDWVGDAASLRQLASTTRTTLS